MAVIKNKKTGMWEVRTYYKDLTGERKQKTKRGFVKKNKALEWERNFKLKENQSISMSFKSFVDIYLTDLEPRIKRNTFLTKKHIIETKILPYFGKRKLDDIRTSDVIQWQNEIMKLKKDNGELFSPTYLKTIHNQLSAILNHAVNMYGLKDNVARKAGTMGKEENKEIEFWTQEEFQNFLECVADKPISYYAFEMLYWTGIREGELLALTPADFNFKKKTLRINKSYQRLEGEDVITDPKTPKSNRTIVMPDFLAIEMEDFIKSIYGIKMNDRIFTISKSYLHHEMDRGAIAVGLDTESIEAVYVKPGETTAMAVTGRVGCGKSTMLQRIGQMVLEVDENTLLYCLDTEKKSLAKLQEKGTAYARLSEVEKVQDIFAQILKELMSRMQRRKEAATEIEKEPWIILLIDDIKECNSLPDDIQLQLHRIMTKTKGYGVLVLCGIRQGDLFNFYTQDQLGVDLKSSGSALALSDTAVHYEGFYKNNFVQSQRNAELEKGFGIFFADNGGRKIKCIDSQEAGR